MLAANIRSLEVLLLSSVQIKLGYRLWAYNQEERSQGRVYLSITINHLYLFEQFGYLRHMPSVLEIELSCLRENLELDLIFY